MPPEPTPNREIRGLTVRQPFACCIAHLGKDVENRSWAPPGYLIGGHLAIHAGRTVEVEAKMQLQDAIRFGTRPDLNLPAHFPLHDRLELGAIIAVAQLRGVVYQGADGCSSFGDVPDGWESPWFNGPFGWVLGPPRVLARSVPCKGNRGLWELPPDVLVQVRAEFGRAA